MLELYIFCLCQLKFVILYNIILQSIFSLYLFAYLTFYRYIAKESKKRRLYEKVNEFSRVYTDCKG